MSCNGEAREDETGLLLRLFDSCGVARVSADGVVVFWCTGAQRLTGIPSDAVVGTLWRQLPWLPFDTVNPPEDLIDRARRDGAARAEARQEWPDLPPALDLEARATLAAGAGYAILLTDASRRYEQARDLSRRIEVLESHSEERAEAMVRANRALEQEIIERTRAQDRQRVQYERALALRALDTAIASTFDLSMTMGLLVHQVTWTLKAGAAAVLLDDPRRHRLVCAAAHGLPPEIEAMTASLDVDASADAVEECDVIFLSTLTATDCRTRRMKAIRAAGFISYLAVPLIAKDRVLGVIEILHRDTFEPDTEIVEFLGTLAAQTAMAVDNAELVASLKRSNEELSEAYDATIAGWSRALDLRDRETEGHCRRVTEMTETLARALGFEGNDLAQARRGALLHDIGKMGVPDSILMKPGRLTDEEFRQIKRHPRYAYDMLRPIAFLKQALDIPYCHHEKWDGTGYPRGLKGDAIPLAARIFSIVDVWDALSNDRRYRKKWPPERVREHIASLSGTHFDPEVVEAALPILFGQAEPLRKAA